MAIPEDSGGKRTGERGGWKVSKSCQRMKKTVGSENHSSTNCGGGFSNSAVEIEGLLKGDRSK